MAKSKSFFGLRRGSTRDHTFYIQDGKQITRSRVEHVKNPRSLAQMQQRMVMTTAIAAYKCMKEICDHSWEGVEYGAKSFQKFMAVNTKLLKEAIGTEDNYNSYNEFGNSLFCSGEYKVSDGSLPIGNRNTFYLQVISLEINYTAFSFKLLGDYGESLTTHAILESNNLSVGDTITFLILRAERPTKSKLYWLRMTIRDDSTEEISNKNINEHLSFQSNYKLLVDVIQEVFTINMMIQHEIWDENFNCYYGSITSHLQNNEWLRSPCTMIWTNDGAGFTSPSDALATYPIAHNYILNGK